MLASCLFPCRYHIFVNVFYCLHHCVLWICPIIYLADPLLLYSLPCSRFSGTSEPLSGPQVPIKSALREEASLGSYTQIKWPFICFLGSAVIPGVQASLCLSSWWAVSHFGVWFVLEPGYYEDGAFGIRIENVVLVVPVKTKVSN